MLLMYFVLLALGVTKAMAVYQKGFEGVNLGTFGGHLPNAVKVVKVTNTVAVPVPYPIPFSKNVPYPISVPKPIPYAVPQPIPVEVTKPVVISQPIPFEVPKPYPVSQHFPMKSPQQQHFMGMSFPNEMLMAPQFHGNQQNDYQAYLSYNGGAPSFSPSSPSFGQGQSVNAHQLFGGQGGYNSQAMLSSPAGFGPQNEYSPQTGFGSHSGFGSQNDFGSQAGLISQSGYGSQTGFSPLNGFASQTGYGHSEPSQGMFNAPAPVHENFPQMMVQGTNSGSSPMLYNMMRELMMNQGNAENGNHQQGLTMGHNFESSNSIDSQGHPGQLSAY